MSWLVPKDGLQLAVRASVASGARARARSVSRPSVSTLCRNCCGDRHRSFRNRYGNARHTSVCRHRHWRPLWCRTRNADPRRPAGDWGEHSHGDAVVQLISCQGRREDRGVYLRDYRGDCIPRTHGSLRFSVSLRRCLGSPWLGQSAMCRSSSGRTHPKIPRIKGRPRHCFHAAPSQRSNAFTFNSIPAFDVGQSVTTRHSY